MVCNVYSLLTYCCPVCRAFNFVCLFLPSHVKDDKLEESKQYCAADAALLLNMKIGKSD